MTGVSLAASLSRSFSRFARREALLDLERDSLSYAALAAETSMAGAVLRSGGVAPGARVALVAGRGPEGLLGFLAISATATCVPLNPADPPEELRKTLTSARVAAVLCEENSATISVALDLGLGVFAFTRSALKICLPLRVVRKCQDSPQEFAQADLPLLLHTSGSAGRSKIVPLSDKNVGHTVTAMRRFFGLSSNDRCLNIMPLFHVHGLIAAGLASLSAGSALCIPNSFPVDRSADLFDAFRPTWFTATPSIHYAIAAGKGAAGSRLRFVRSSSAPLAPAVIPSLEDWYGAPLIEAYGLTETASIVASNPLPPGIRKPGGVGRPFTAEVIVADSNGRKLDRGAEGEILVKGPGVIQAYWGDAAGESASFRAGWFRTGDLGLQDSDGHLFIRGRAKEWVKRGGENVSLAEVDEAMRSVSAVDHAISFAIDHPTLHQDIVGAAVLRPGSHASGHSIRREMLRRFSRRGIPAEIVIVDRIPTSAVGKPLRQAAAEQFRPLLALKGGSPRTASQSAILKTWRELLGRADFGIFDNVFLMGGDPIRARLAAERLNSKLGARVCAADLFEFPTVLMQAQLIDASANPPGGAGQPG